MRAAKRPKVQESLYCRTLLLLDDLLKDCRQLAQTFDATSWAEPLESLPAAADESHRAEAGVGRRSEATLRRPASAFTERT